MRSGAGGPAGFGVHGRPHDRAARRQDRAPRADGPVEVSFEAEFDSEIRSELGDLGPDTRGGDDRGGDRGNRRRR